jgi:hypothetical protein
MGMKVSPVYHWSPVERHDEILKSGLQPYSVPTVVSSTEVAMPYICFGTSPATAWYLSGDMDYVSEIEDWDLWEVILNENDEVHIRAFFGNEIKEVRAYNSIPADRVWWVGQRTAPYGKFLDRSAKAKAGAKKRKKKKQQ